MEIIRVEKETDLKKHQLYAIVEHLYAVNRLPSTLGSLPIQNLSGALICAFRDGLLAGCCVISNGEVIHLYLDKTLPKNIRRALGMRLYTEAKK